VYQKPHLDYYDQLHYPWGYRVPEFSKFSGDDGKTTLEHVGQFILQCGEASANNALQGLLLLLLILYLFGHNWNKNFMNTFTLAILSLDYHILLPLSKNIMSVSLSTLGDLGTVGISALT
jgi:hypothetical protein